MTLQSIYHAVTPQEPPLLETKPLINKYCSQIIENVGGRLLLRYDTPDSSLPDFWLFYTSPRLFSLGWVDEKGWFTSTEYKLLVCSAFIFARAFFFF